MGGSLKQEFSPDFFEEVDHLLEQYSPGELRHLIKDYAALADKPHPYEPFDEQLGFHRSQASVRMIVAGNRSGKSESACRDLVWLLLGTHPYIKWRSPIKAWVAGNSFKQIGKILWPKIKSYLEPRHVNQSKKNSEGYIDRIELINGSTIDFKTYKQDSMDWESEDLDVLLCDEPPPREHYMAAQRGMVDRGGKTVIAATPLREPWLHEELWQKAGKPGYDIAAFQWSSYANPHTNHKALRAFEMSLTPEERKTRIYGEFKKLIGRVLNHFDADSHQVIPARPWPSDWPYFEGLDPHMSKAHGVIRLGLTPKRNAVLFHAGRPMGGMEDLANHIRATRPENSVPRCDPIVDTSVQQFDNSIGMTQRDQLANYGIDTILAIKKDQLLAGLERLNQLFYYSKLKRPEGLYVMESCVEFINEANRLVWDDKKEDTPKGDDDLIDPVRYVVQHNPWEICAAKIVRPKYNASYSTQSTAMPGQPGQSSAQDPRKYSNKAFDLDLDDDDEKQQYSVRY